MAKIITAQALLEENVENGYTETSHLFTGDKTSNLNSNMPDIVENSRRSITLNNKVYENTEVYNKLWNRISDLLKSAKKNMATFDSESYYELVDKLRLDVTRRRLQRPDLTQLLDVQTIGLNDSKSITLDEFAPYGAVFLEDNFRGNGVNLIDQKYGATGTIIHQGHSVAWAETLENELYNIDLDKMMKVNEAVARGFSSKRNDLSMGEIVGKTTDSAWDSSQQEPAATGSGLTNEELLYQTLNSAIERLTNLKDPQTDQYIQSDRIFGLCNRGDLRRVNRAINGQLNNSKGLTSNRTALTEISSLIPYDGDKITVGKKSYTYNGVAKNKMYLYVPGVASYTRVKRPLTQQVSAGSALTLSTDAMAWYFIQQSWRQEFFGSSDATIKARLAAEDGNDGSGYGFVVEVVLPS